MKFVFVPYRPRGILAKYILFLWYAYGEENRIVEKVLPNGVVEWIINTGTSPHAVLDSDGLPKIRSFKKSWIAGIQSRYLTIQSFGETKLFGIRFKPGGMAAFSDIPASEFANGVYEMHEVMGEAIHHVRDELLENESNGLHAQFRVLERFLNSRHRSGHRGRLLRHHPHVSAAIQQLHNNRHRSIRSIAGEIGISQKQLINHFRITVGLTPKMLQSIFAFQQSLKLLNCEQRMHFADLAQFLGYSDQAHFNHDFKKFSGTTPQLYLQTVTLDINHIQVNRT